MVELRSLTDSGADLLTPDDLLAARRAVVKYRPGTFRNSLSLKLDRPDHAGVTLKLRRLRAWKLSQGVPFTIPR